MEIQADFCGDNKEAQASVDLVEKEVSATDYELKAGRWTLNQIDYQKAAKSDALLQVDSCIQKLQDAINAPQTISVEEMNCASQLFICDVLSIKSLLEIKTGHTETQTLISSVLTFDKDTDGSIAVSE